MVKFPIFTFGFPPSTTPFHPPHPPLLRPFHPPPPSVYFHFALVIEILTRKTEGKEKLCSVLTQIGEMPGKLLTTAMMRHHFQNSLS